MHASDLLPLAGVAVGWLLKELSDYARHRFVTRGEIGHALTGLLRLEAELHRLELMLSIQKKRPISWDEYETIRQETAKRYLTRTNPRELVVDAVKQLSQYDPLQAATLHDLSEMLSLAYNAKLPPADRNTADYVKALSMMEVATDVAANLLRRLILKLARLYGPLTFLRIKWDWRSRVLHSRSVDRQFIETQIREIYERFDETPKSQAYTDETGQPESCSKPKQKA